jgi:DNA polymerase III subunit delta
MPVLIIAGDEEFEISRRVAQLKTTLVEENWRAMNFIRLTNPGLPELIEAAASLPFGEGNRLVLIDRCELFSKRRSKGASPAEGGSKPAGKGAGKQMKDSDSISPETFEAALASVYERTYLVFACSYNFDTTLKLSKAAMKYAELENFTKEKHFPGAKNAKLETWCRKEAKRFGATIEDAAIDYLLEGADAGLRQLSSEIEKAATAILPATHITAKVVVRLSPHYSHVFVLAERWLGNQKGAALKCLEELLLQQSALPILAALETMLSKWIKMKILAEEFNDALPKMSVGRKELPLPELAKRVANELKLMPFSVERDLKRLSPHNSEELIAKRMELSRLEFLIKSGQIPEKHALELFVLK